MESRTLESSDPSLTSTASLDGQAVGSVGGDLFVLCVLFSYSLPVLSKQTSIFDSTVIISQDRTEISIRVVIRGPIRSN